MLHNSNENILQFDQGVMTLSAYDPLRNQYQKSRVLQLPKLPLLESLEHLFIENNSSNNSNSIRPTKSTRSAQMRRSSSRGHNELLLDGIDKDISSFNRRRRCQSNPSPNMTTTTVNLTASTTSTFTAAMKKRALHKFGSLTRRMSKRSSKNDTTEESVVSDNASFIHRSSHNSKIRYHKRSLSNAFQAAFTGIVQKANKKIKHRQAEQYGWTHQSWVEELRFSTESMVSLYSLNQPLSYTREPSATTTTATYYKDVKNSSLLREDWWMSSPSIRKDSINVTAAAF
ncbi:hypothetical protein BDF20DRAFT_589031 [Mycotypha africana]|uniref:uncharacterized protein n=1 Tax=Mycotypha africana TaxID=64632 RepID=UPI002300D459|nr:uncharacterized protein BDF20DRAFT_589031 [Mycotypha africana]KAI8975151.1 hypothetical protein BDF20DRAFT_589031 [Mycotypha africana]